MQKSYLVKQAINFGQASNFFIRPGDILVFDSSNQNKMTVYRNAEIQKIITGQSYGSLQAMVKMGWLTEIHGLEAPKLIGQASKTAPPATQKPAEAVKPLPKAVTTPAPAPKPVQAPKPKPVSSLADSTN